MQKPNKYIYKIFIFLILFYEMYFDHIFGIVYLTKILKFIIIVIFSYFSFNSLLLKSSKGVLKYYIFPIILYLIGFISSHSLSLISDINLLNQFASLIPWLSSLSVPYLLSKINNKEFISKTWSIYNNVIFICIFLSLIEYFLAISGKISLRPITIQGNNFMTGITCIFYALKSGEIHLRYYGAFIEPGTTAMMILPALVYSLFNRKYIFSVIYIFAIYFTNGLGGFISLAIITPLYIFYNFKNVLVRYTLLFLILFTSLVYSNDIVGYYSNQIESKGLSKEVRISNIIKPFQNIDKLIINYPLGIEKVKLSGNIREKNKLWFGNNFSPLKAFYDGGLFSLLGFSIFLFTIYFTLFKQIFTNNINSIYSKVILLSLIALFPFNFQRVPIEATTIFSFLFAPYILIKLSNKKLN